MDPEPTPPDEAFEVRAEPGVGLSALLSLAAKAGAPDGAPLGVLDLELIADEGPAVSVEAFFAHQGLLRQLQRLDVRVHVAVTSKPAPKLVDAALDSFAGTTFTNLVLARADAKELCDFTVSVAPRLPVWASNALLVGEDLSPEEARRCGEVFARLGISSSSGAHLSVARHQVRRPPTRAQQVDAFSAACERFAHAELFASPLPPQQSVRLAFHGADGRGEIDLTLTRSDLEHASVAKRTSDQMQALLREQLGFEFEATRWRGRNFHGERSPFESRGVFPDRPERGWSVNWNARSR